jgi:hypothetical protein
VYQRKVETYAIDELTSDPELDGIAAVAMGCWKRFRRTDVTRT